jgi:hypothetical protein
MQGDEPPPQRKESTMPAGTATARGTGTGTGTQARRSQAASPGTTAAAQAAPPVTAPVSRSSGLPKPENYAPAALVMPAQRKLDVTKTRPGQTVYVAKVLGSPWFTSGTNRNAHRVLVPVAGAEVSFSPGDRVVLGRRTKPQEWMGTWEILAAVTGTEGDPKVDGKVPDGHSKDMVWDVSPAPVPAPKAEEEKVAEPGEGEKTEAPAEGEASEAPETAEAAGDGEPAKA